MAGALHILVLVVTNATSIIFGSSRTEEGLTFRYWPSQVVLEYWSLNEWVMLLYCCCCINCKTTAAYNEQSGPSLVLIMGQSCIKKLSYCRLYSCHQTFYPAQGAWSTLQNFPHIYLIITQKLVAVSHDVWAHVGGLKMSGDAGALPLRLTRSTRLSTRVTEQNLVILGKTIRA